MISFFIFDAVSTDMPQELSIIDVQSTRVSFRPGHRVNLPFPSIQSPEAALGDCQS